MNLEPGAHQNIFLIGYRCTGKSAVGKLLSERLGWPFIDTDSLLVSDSGKSIREIVKRHGWETFRRMEHAVIKKVCFLERRIVATGGGVVLNEANVKQMKNNGSLVWLKATPETIKSRMMLDTSTEEFRPALSSKDSFAEIEDTLAEREPFYTNAMDFHVETDNREINAVCDEVVRQLGELYHNLYRQSFGA